MSRIRCTKCGYIERVDRAVAYRAITKHRDLVCPARLQPSPEPKRPPFEKRPYRESVPKKSFCPECREQMAAGECFVCGWSEDQL